MAYPQPGSAAANHYQHGRLKTATCYKRITMNLVTEPYLVQVARWPKTGRHILAQYDAETIIVYQAFSPAMGHFAAEHGYFGGDFNLQRMSWIKPNFLWMMYRSGWATKPDQHVILA